MANHFNNNQPRRLTGSVRSNAIVLVLVCVAVGVKVRTK